MAWFERGEMRVYYEESGSGEPVLLLPGWGGSIDEFGGLREALATAGFRVIAADLPGSGKSGPQPRTFTPSYFADDAAVFLEMLDALGAAPAHLAGFSDGGEYALVMAEQRPAAVRSLVTWGAAGSTGTNLEMAEMMMTVVDQPIPLMAGFSEYLKATYGEANARVMTQSAGRSFRAIMEAGGDISRSRAGESACPALLITGEHDFLATPALVSDMAAAIPGGEFLEAKGASHDVYAEQPEWLTQTVVGWLGRQ
jgi:valacyclovir hydrolase